MNPELSVLCPVAPSRAEQLLPYAALVQTGRAARLWQGQSGAVDPLTLFASMAGAGFRVPTGLGVTLTPFQHPFAAALQARSLAAVTGHPVVAGFGPGATSLQGSLGSVYRSPLTACREFLTILRDLLHRGEADVDGEYFSCRNGLAELAAPRVSTGLGVLRPAMARLAGELADVAITWLTPPSYLQEVLVPAIRSSAAAAGRPAPRVTVMVPAALGGEDRDPAGLAWHGVMGHAQLPHYRQMLTAAGVVLDPDDPGRCAAELIRSGTFLHGTPAELRAGVQRYADAGADEVVLTTSGVCLAEGRRAAYEETRRILEVVR